MKLNSIKIKNFRSLKELQINIDKLNESYTYSLLGINESGKTSILKAIDFYDSKIIKYPEDFFENTKSVEVEFYYELSKETLEDILNDSDTLLLIPDELKKLLSIKEVKIKREHSIDGLNKVINTFDQIYKFPEYTFKNNMIIKKETESDSDFIFNDFINENYPESFWKYSHKIILWRSTPEYLILDSIDLIKFGEKPREISVPLLNCFKLIGIDEEKIKDTISKLNTPIAIHNIQNKLSDDVTTHIKQVWPEHPIKIKFQISDQKITFLVEDENVNYKAKTTEQRSDGFKQFISFLLTLSIENANNELSQTILLIDEPEVHLHPPAQINLLKELIQITSNSKNNIVFFATHSNYMIDKENLNRSYKVIKIDNEYTKIERLQDRKTTYSEVNFEVFEICTNDYHNELYGYLEDVEKLKLDSLSKSKSWINEKSKKTEKVSLPTYIRHSIHHPENTSNKKFTELELKKSILQLRQLKYSS